MGIFLALAGLVLLALLAEQALPWAFEHLAALARPLRWAAALLLVAVASRRARETLWSFCAAIGRRLARAPRLAATAACALAFALFWLLRQRNYELGDSSLLIQLLTRYVHLRGFHVTYDEPLELYLHSLAYGLLHAGFGWTVEDSYALVSALAGVAFVILLARFWREAAPTAGRAALATALTLATAASQLFFGYVENYTLVAVGLLLYVLLARRCLAGRCALLWPALVVGTSISLHVLAGWLLPSLLYLAWQDVRRSSGNRSRAFGAVSFGVLAPVALTVGWLTTAGLPLGMLGKTHLWQLKFVFFTEPGTVQHQYAAFSPAHLAAQANQLLLVGLPALALGAWLVLCARSALPRGDPFLRLLALVAGSLQLFASTWNPELGPYRDWDLFAPAGFYWVVLATYALVRADLPDLRLRDAALPVLALSLILTASWVTSNARRTTTVDALHDDAHYRAALQHQREGRTPAAERDLQEALRINPRNGQAAIGYAELLARRGELVRATGVLRDYLALDPTGPAADQARRMLAR